MVAREDWNFSAPLRDEVLGSKRLISEQFGLGGANEEEKKFSCCNCFWARCYGDLCALGGLVRWISCMTLARDIWLRSRPQNRCSLDRTAVNLQRTRPELGGESCGIAVVRSHVKDQTVFCRLTERLSLLSHRFSARWASCPQGNALAILKGKHNSAMFSFSLFILVCVIVLAGRGLNEKFPESSIISERRGRAQKEASIFYGSLFY